MENRSGKTGLWLIGACGGVGSTVALGLAALRRNLIPETGLVMSLPAFQDADLIDVNSMVVGGHEVRQVNMMDAVREMHAEAGVFRPEWIDGCASELRAVQRNIRPGTLYGASRAVRALVEKEAPATPARKEDTPRKAIARIAADIAAFRRRHRLGRVIVVNVASSEPPIKRLVAHDRWSRLERELTRRHSQVVPTSAVYALAAFEAHCSFINFTPSPALSIPAVRERADELGLPYMGNDGKTGETLVKSVLAPMFAMRHLRVLSWVGQNVLGNRDGAVLSDPSTQVSKIRSKDGLVARIVGGRPMTHVSIDYVPSLHDWKIAWDLIHFEGFLGTKMTMQFTWQGCDSALAAPLVIDLARLADREHRLGRKGPMPHLSFFFKDPINAERHDLAGQWTRLVEHVRAAPRT